MCPRPRWWNFLWSNSRYETIETPVCWCYLCACLSPYNNVSTWKTRLKTHLSLKLLESLSQHPTQRMTSINVYGIELRQLHGTRLLGGTTFVCDSHGKIHSDHFFLFIVSFLVECLLKRQVKSIASQRKVLRRCDLWESREDKCSSANIRCLTSSKYRSIWHEDEEWPEARVVQRLRRRVLGEMTPLFPSLLPFALLDPILLDPQMLGPCRLSSSQNDP